MCTQTNKPKRPPYLQEDRGRNARNWDASQGPYAISLILDLMYLYAIKKGDAKPHRPSVFSYRSSKLASFRRGINAMDRASERHVKVSIRLVCRQPLCQRT